MPVSFFMFYCEFFAAYMNNFYTSSSDIGKPIRAVFILLLSDK